MANYTYQSEVIYSTQTQARSNCSGILFINTGSINVFVNDSLLIPGASLSLDTQERDIDQTTYSIKWASQASTAQLTIWRKIYK